MATRRKKTGLNNASIDLFNGVSVPTKSSLLDYWHIHTSKSVTIDNPDGTTVIATPAIGSSGITQFGRPIPTPGDGPVDAGMKARGCNATAIQVDTIKKSNNVNFYSGTTVNGTMSLTNFKKLW